MKAVHIQMKERSIKTRQDCFALLKELVSVLPGAVASHVPALIPGIQYSLGYTLHYVAKSSLYTTNMTCS